MESLEFRIICLDRDSNFIQGMSLTNNLKPSGFQPVGGGELLYKWTESTLTGKTNYRVVLQFNGYTATLPDFEFRPDASLVIWADIAPILRSLLALDETVASRLINTYVKYQAVWDESSDAQVNLTGDVIYAYVGNNHSLNERTNYDIQSTDGNASKLLATGVFLSYDNIKLFTSRGFYIDFLCAGDLPVDARIAYWKIDTSTNTNVSVFDGSVKGLQSLAVTITASGKYYILITNNAGTLFYGILSIEVEDECNNPVYLRWLNDYGGLTHYTFDYNQIFGFQIGRNDKAKFYEIASYGVSFDQWLMLNELNKEGLVYNDNYKLGQFVEDVTDYANPVSLIVIPQELSTQTKRVVHDFRTAIRYPLIPNTDI